MSMPAITGVGIAEAAPSAEATVDVVTVVADKPGGLVAVTLAVVVDAVVTDAVVLGAFAVGAAALNAEVEGAAWGRSETVGVMVGATTDAVVVVAAATVEEGVRALFAAAVPGVLPTVFDTLTAILLLTLTRRAPWAWLDVANSPAAANNEVATRVSVFDR
jgi:hypothetical protein